MWGGTVFRDGPFFVSLRPLHPKRPQGQSAATHEKSRTEGLLPFPCGIRPHIAEGLSYLISSDESPYDRKRKSCDSA